MKIEEARRLKVGDLIKVIKNGMSKEPYKKGQMGFVSHKEGEESYFFSVTLLDKRKTELGIVAIENWEKLKK